MKNTFVAGILITILVWILGGLYAFFVPLQPWIVFGAMGGLAMSLACKCKPGGQE